MPDHLNVNDRVTFAGERMPCTVQAANDRFAVVHGVDCEKVPHTGPGYLHAADDDRRYDVDGVQYCGRCHRAVG
jgi:hypothetical protein